jgi:hypothetical protein
MALLTPSFCYLPLLYKSPLLCLVSAAYPATTGRLSTLLAWRAIRHGPYIRQSDSPPGEERDKEGSSEIKNTEITDEGPVTMETKPNRLDRSLALWQDVAILVPSPSSSRRHCGVSARHIIHVGIR